MDSRKRTSITGLTFLLVIILVVGCIPNNQGGFTCLCLPFLKTKPSQQLPSQAMQIPDQDRLIAAFGYPDEFTIIFDEGQDNLRMETWLYTDLERYFTFVNGKYTGGDMVMTPKLVPGISKAKPGDFVYGMSQQGIGKLLGEQGTAVIDEASGYTAVIYNQGQISCMFNNRDQLVTVLRTRTVSGSN
jgi:hypothetical protein